MRVTRLPTTCSLLIIIAVGGEQRGGKDKGVKVSAAPAASGDAAALADDTFLIASSNFSPRKPTLGFSLFPSLLSEGGNAGSSFSPDFLDVQQ